MKFHIKGPEGFDEVHKLGPGTYVLGRGRQTDICVRSDSLSRQHCQFFIGSDDSVYVTDLGSTNGVTIDGERISSHEKIKVESFFTLKIADLFEIEISPEEDIVPIVPQRTKSKPAKENPKKEIKKKAVTSDDRRMLVYFLLAIALMGSIYYLTEVKPEQEKIELAKNEAIHNQATRPQRAAPLKLKTISLLELRKAQKCQSPELAPLCSMKGKLELYEGYLIKDKILYGYFSLLNEEKRQKDGQWKMRPDRDEILVAFNLYHQEMMKLAQSSDLELVKIVIFETNEDQIFNLFMGETKLKSEVLMSGAFSSLIDKINANDFSQFSELRQHFTFRRLR